MYQRILVPIAGSATAGQALQEAIRLADGRAQLRLIYVLEEVYPLDAEGYAFIDYEALRKAGHHPREAPLAKAAEKVRQAGATVETALLEAAGERIDGVIDGEALHWDAD